MEHALAASSLWLTLLLPATPAAAPLHAETPALLATLATAADAAAVHPPAQMLPATPAAVRPLFPSTALPGTSWTPKGRPGALTGMYVSYGALQLLDVYSTRRAIGGGAAEVNPLMRPIASNTAAMLAVKGLSTAASVYFAERASKRNRKAGVILMAALNGVTAWAVSQNMKQNR